MKEQQKKKNEKNEKENELRWGYRLNRRTSSSDAGEVGRRADAGLVVGQRLANVDVAGLGRVDDDGGRFRFRRLPQRHSLLHATGFSSKSINQVRERSCHYQIFKILSTSYSLWLPRRLGQPPLNENS